MTGVLAIDAGQTGMKVRVSGTSGADLDLLFPGIRTHEPLLPQLGRGRAAASPSRPARSPMSSPPASRA